MTTKTVGGFGHLSGKYVTVTASGFLLLGDDGVAYTNTSVQLVDGNGCVAVDYYFYGTVLVGASYTCRGKTLPPSYEAAAAARGTVKNVSRVFLRMNGAGTARVGPSSSKLAPMVVQQADAGEIPALSEIPLFGDWNNEAQVVWEHDDPDPFIIQSMVLEIATGG